MGGLNEVTGRITSTPTPTTQGTPASGSQTSAATRGASYPQGRAALSPNPAGPLDPAACGAPRAVPVPAVIPVARIADPVARNQAINQSYHQFDMAMSAYFGGHITIANWFTYGQHASREAGTQIRNLDDGLGVLQEALTIANTAIASGGDPDVLLPQVPAAMASIRKVLRLVQQPGMAGQAVQLAMARAGISAADLQQVVDDYNALSTVTWTDLIPGHVALEQVTFATHLVGLAGRLAGAIPAIVASLVRIRNNMISGNRQIYENVAPACQTFLAAANGRSDGNPGRLGFAGDPSGFLGRAFELYGQMRVLSDRIACAPESPDAGQHRARIVQMAQEANLLVGFQEQLIILQPIFDTMQAELQAIAGTMSLTDPNGTHRLLPNGGNWGDFYTRMGIDPARAPADPRTITAGNLPPLLPSSDPRSRGTIAEYFNGNTTNARIHDAPRNIQRL